jgi:Extensin-like protein C-terminus
VARVWGSNGVGERSPGRRATSVGVRVARNSGMARSLPAVLTVLLCSCAREHTPDQLEAGGAAMSARALGRDAAPRYPAGQYPLDGLRRKASGDDCPEVKLQKFSGETLRLSPSARINPSFRQPLLELEQVVREVSMRLYSRVPSSILVAASYGCRTVNGSGRRLSEHALGNAIDIKGFRFAPEEDAQAKGSSSSTKKTSSSKTSSAAKTSGAQAKAATKSGAKGETFDVLVAKHWKARGDASERLASRFLHELTEALLERDVFRTLLGPAHRDHDDHFHFDMAPTHYVDL